jgi:DNA-binding beta-propeller fold protein YncE
VPVITEIMDSSGDGTYTLTNPDGIAVDADGNVFVAGCGNGSNDAVFMIEPDGTKTRILDTSGDGVHALACPVGVAVDAAGNVYVAAFSSDNVFRRTPGGVVTQILDSTGDGTNGLDGPLDVAVSASGDLVYVTGNVSDNVFEIDLSGTPSVTEILDATGAGPGQPLDNPFGIALHEATGDVYVAGFHSDNAFRIEPGGAVTEIIGPAGAGPGQPLDTAHGIAVDATGDVYVTGNSSDNLLRISGGQVAEIMDASGDGAGNPLDNPTCLALDATGTLYVAAFDSRNVFARSSAGDVEELLADPNPPFSNASDDCMALDADGNVYVTGTGTHNVYRIEIPRPPPAVPALGVPQRALLVLFVLAVAVGFSRKGAAWQ